MESPGFQLYKPKANSKPKANAKAKPFACKCCQKEFTNG
uniref:Uncharacterized protein n=1 Tax=viral metagenome TaxID=1070528 RepID=A0A6C0L722_9ZZZZ